MSKSIFRTVGGMKVEIPVERAAFYNDRHVVLIRRVPLKQPLGCRLVEHDGRPYLAKGRKYDADFYYMTPDMLNELRKQNEITTEPKNVRRSDGR